MADFDFDVKGGAFARLTMLTATSGAFAREHPYPLIPLPSFYIYSAQTSGH